MAAIAMRGLATAYDHLDRHDEALPLWRELIELRTAKAASPDADARTLNSAAWTLLTHDLEELRDPERALGCAERPCELGEWTNANHLDTLALAQHRTSNTAAAVETQKRAIELAPEDQHEGLKASLSKYEAALDAEAGATNDDQR